MLCTHWIQYFGWFSFSFYDTSLKVDPLAPVSTWMFLWKEGIFFLLETIDLELVLRVCRNECQDLTSEEIRRSASQD